MASGLDVGCQPLAVWVQLVCVIVWKKEREKERKNKNVTEFSLVFRWNQGADGASKGPGGVRYKQGLTERCEEDVR